MIKNTRDFYPVLLRDTNNLVFEVNVKTKVTGAGAGGFSLGVI